MPLKNSKQFSYNLYATDVKRIPHSGYDVTHVYFCYYDARKKYKLLTLTFFTIMIFRYLINYNMFYFCTNRKSISFIKIIIINKLLHTSLHILHIEFLFKFYIF